MNRFAEKFKLFIATYFIMLAVILATATGLMAITSMHSYVLVLASLVYFSVGFFLGMLLVIKLKFSTVL